MVGETLIYYYSGSNVINGKEYPFEHNKITESDCLFLVNYMFNMYPELNMQIIRRKGAIDMLCLDIRQFQTR